MSAEPPPTAATLKADSGPRMKAALEGLCSLLIGAAVMGGWSEMQARSLLFVGLEAFLGWGAVVAIIHSLYQRWRPVEENPAPRFFSFAFTGQWLLLLAGLVVIGKISYPGLGFSYDLNVIPANNLRLTAGGAARLRGGSLFLHELREYCAGQDGRDGAGSGARLGADGLSRLRGDLGGHFYFPGDAPRFSAGGWAAFSWSSLSSSWAKRC